MSGILQLQVLLKFGTYPDMEFRHVPS